MLSIGGEWLNKTYQQLLTTNNIKPPGKLIKNGNKKCIRMHWEMGVPLDNISYTQCIQ